jgi:hypothetical protein
MNNEVATEFTITGAFQSLRGGRLVVTTNNDNGSLPIGDGRINASFRAGRVTSVAGYDASGRECFIWAVPALPDGVGLFFSKDPNGSLKLATSASQQ